MFGRISRFLTLFLQALKGEEHDYTKGSINRAIFLLAVPMIAEMSMEALFAVVDMFFVAKVSVNAVAAVGLTESVLMVIYSIAVGFSMAVTAIVARRVGEKNFDQASDAAFQAILLAVIIGLPLGLLGYFFAGDVLALMGGDADLIEEGSAYAEIMYASNVSIILLFLNNAIFRGAGNASLAMRTLILANGLNILLDPLFIFGWGPVPAMGVQGAALATAIGRTTGVAYQFYHLLKGSSVVKIALRNMIINIKLMVEMVRIALGGVGQFLVESASWIFIVRVVAIFGSSAIAAYAITFRIAAFTLLPSWGLASSAATMVGQNLGAKNPERAERAVWITSLYNTLFLLGVSILLFLFSDQVISFFTTVAEVKSLAIMGLRIICLGYVFFSVGMVMSQAFNGAGDTQTPLWINVAVFWFVQIPLAYVLAVTLDWRGNGVFASIAIAHSLFAIVALWIFRKGKWKTIEV